MKTRTHARSEFLTAIITDAIESGISSWCRVEGYRWFSPELDGGSATPGPGGTANAYATVTEYDPDYCETIGEPVEVTVDTIASAINRIVTDDALRLTDSTRKMIAKSSKANEAESDFDAGTADLILQIAVLGGHVYA